MDDGNTVCGLQSTVCIAGVVARAVVEPSRDIESLPLAALGGFVRGRISAFEPRESMRQVEGLFESLLSQSFG
jgi:hypothetical protein